MSLKKIRDFVIYKDENYNSFPNAIVQKDGELMVAFRQAPDWQQRYGKVTHVDPSSKGVYVLSHDNGATWDKKTSLIYDDYYKGIQDPCITVLRDGTLFCTFFTWKVFEKEDTEKGPSDFLMYDRWVGRLGGVYSIRSADGGRTWDEPICIEGQCIGVRGNCIELEDGSILLPMYGHQDDPSRSIVAVTKDRGKSWETLSIIASSEEMYYQEPNLYQTDSGKLVALLRTRKLKNYENDDVKSPLYTCESFDNGKTWSEPREHAIYSPSPFHALRLNSGKVLITYGYRVKPYGLRALLLDSECSNLDEAEEIVLREDGLGTDIGYTSAIQLEDGNILITYYYYDEEMGVRYIAGTLCSELES